MFTVTPLPFGRRDQRASVGAADISTGKQVLIGTVVVGVIGLGAWLAYRDYQDMQALSPKERLEMRNKRMLIGAANTLAENIHIG